MSVQVELWAVREEHKLTLLHYEISIAKQIRFVRGRGVGGGDVIHHQGSFRPNQTTEPTTH
jgi:hypothetical protein